MKRRKKIFYFEWATRPTSLNEKWLYRNFIRRGYYSEPNLRHLKRLKTPDSTKSKIISLLTLKLTEKAGFRTSRAYSLFPRLNDEYHKQGALKMAEKYDIPPFSICTAYEKCNPHMRNHIWHVKQKRHASSLDITSPVNSDRFKELADTFEDDLIRIFDRYGVQYKTENHLKEEQIAQFGRAIATVDILFTDDVYINGKLIRWLECKNYILASNKIVEPKVKKQLQRYINMWGSGAVVYRHGYLFDFPMDGVTTFDGENLDRIDLVEEEHFA